ncbi:MAG: hypothetical protein ACHP9Z_11625, partial [Streptosporangiales bacterium]
MLPEPGAQIRLDGSLVTVVAATSTPYGADLVIRRGDGTLADVALTHAELDQGSDPKVERFGGRRQQPAARSVVGSVWAG